MHKRVSDRFVPLPLAAMPIQPSVTVKELGLGTSRHPVVQVSFDGASFTRAMGTL